MNELTAVCCFIAIVTACKQLYNRFVATEREQEQEQEVQQQYSINSYQQVREQVTALQQTIQRIDGLSNLRTDLSVSSPDNLKNITISCPDSLSNDSKYNFLITGTDNNSRLLQTIATEEQKRLTCHLLRQIENLYLMICSDGNGDRNELHSPEREVMQHE